ncbi:MAG: hypothetical protein QY321_01370 [Patescibacteria group bacterium]|nr:MAG: hypothetical protein QY321_01370 [Patescibacteria group bacterium]
MKNTRIKKIFFVFIFFSIFALFATENLKAEEECLWLNVRPGLYCSTEMGDINWYKADNAKCGPMTRESLNECCCGPKVEEKERMKPKTILSLSVIGFFAIITTMILLIRNNEKYN